MGTGLCSPMNVVDADVRVEYAMLPASDTPELSNAVVQQFLCWGDWTALHTFPLRQFWNK
jgi:hypothetical protein